MGRSVLDAGIACRASLVALVVFALLPTSARARSCDVDGADAIGMARTRSKIVQHCPCEGTRESYERCVVRRIDNAITREVVPRSCRPQLMTLLRHTRCGRPGAVTCCRTAADGTSKAFIARDAAACRPNVAEGQACISGSTTTHGACWARVDPLREVACVTSPPCGDGKLDPGEDFDVGPLGTSCVGSIHMACLYEFDGRRVCQGFSYWPPGATEQFGHECRGAIFVDSGKCSPDRQSIIPTAWPPLESMCCQGDGECADHRDTGCAWLTGPYGPWQGPSVGQCGADGQCHPRPRTR